MKITLIHPIVIILACLSLLSCQSNPKTSNTFLDVPQNTVELKYQSEKDSNIIKKPLGSLFDEEAIEYVSLKPNEDGEGLLVTPSSFFYIDNKWLVYDSRNKKSSALLFDQHGEFIRYVGTKGKGPGEYVATSVCKIDRNKKRIVIFDAGVNKVLFFDYQGEFINSVPLPLIFADLISDPYQEGFFLYTLDNCNTCFMPKYGLDKNYFVTKTDSLFQPLFGIEEIESTPDVGSFRNNGNKLFYFGNAIGFINNYSNDLYLIREDGLESLISFDIDGLPFRPKEYIKNADGIRIIKVMEEGFSFVDNLSITTDGIFESITIPTINPKRKSDRIYLYYNMHTQDYTFYSSLEDSSNTYTIGQFYLDPHSSSYDAFAVIQPKDIEEMRESDHPVGKQILSMWKENSNNPILALFKLK